jgi:hypothetical protein
VLTFLPFRQPIAAQNTKKVSSLRVHHFTKEFAICNSELQLFVPFRADGSRALGRKLIFTVQIRLFRAWTLMEPA